MSKKQNKPTKVINLHYVRAAIENGTGIRLSLEEVRALLVEEKLITPYQARNYCPIFKGYTRFFDDDDFTVNVQTISTPDDLL